jgi:hypothetical protein
MIINRSLSAGGNLAVLPASCQPDMICEEPWMQIFRRFEMLKTLIATSAAVAALAVVASVPGNAAPPDFCQGYAQAAINQVRGALANPGCAASIRGPRWSSDFKVHFNWCLTQPIPAVEAERGARTGFLRACRG